MMIEKFQIESRVKLISANRRAADHPVRGGPGWKVFQHTRRDMHRTINYVQQNPVKINQPIQHGDFITEYKDWLPALHPERTR